MIRLHDSSTVRFDLGKVIWKDDAILIVCLQVLLAVLGTHAVAEQRSNLDWVEGIVVGKFNNGRSGYLLELSLELPPKNLIINHSSGQKLITVGGVPYSLYRTLANDDRVTVYQKVRKTPSFMSGMDSTDTKVSISWFGVFCCSIYCRIISIGAPPQLNVIFFSIGQV